MPTSDNVIQEILAPATMIPACGLLLLSTSARMNSLLGRIRAFHHERFGLWSSDPASGSRMEEVKTIRLDGLEFQTRRLLRRARLLRATMVMLFIAIAFNLFSVIGLALRFVLVDESGVLYTASVVVFISGIVGMIGAMVTSLLEASAILETVRYEHGRLESLVEGECPQGGRVGDGPLVSSESPGPLDADS